MTAVKLGFGCMRLPLREDGTIDYALFEKMVDCFLQNGGIYFDTARGYMSGKSERAVKRCLTSRYPREKYLLADKLTASFFDKESDVLPLFESQLSDCGVSYFDAYLMHSQTAESYAKFCRCNAYETALKLRQNGKIRFLGVSFHDKPQLLEQILSTYPQIDFVQLQLNYVDYDDPAVCGRQCLEVCRRHGKKVIVMEPLKGGRLANLDDSALAVLRDCGITSDPKDLALRFAAGLDGVSLVLSGMSDLSQVEQNMAFARSFAPLSDAEVAALYKVKDAISAEGLIECTACKYCVEGCPKGIPIPDLFACSNHKRRFDDWNSDFYYEIVTAHGGTANSCISCGKCEKVCPQHLPIRQHLRQISTIFDKKEKQNYDD